MRSPGGHAQFRLVKVVARGRTLALIRQEDSWATPELTAQDPAEGKLKLATRACVDDRVHERIAVTQPEEYLEHEWGYVAVFTKRACMEERKIKEKLINIETR